MNVKQNTIEKEVTISGKGLHTGVEVTLTFKPAPENFGFKFKRVDLPSQPMIEANVSKVRGTSRGTVLKDGEVTISTIEHVMAALVGSEIDNVLIELNGSEAPILDGSCSPRESGRPAAAGWPGAGKPGESAWRCAPTGLPRRASAGSSKPC